MLHICMHMHAYMQAKGGGNMNFSSSCQLPNAQNVICASSGSWICPCMLAAALRSDLLRHLQHTALPL
jgi:hypothetical protein